MHVTSNPISTNSGNLVMIIGEKAHVGRVII